MAARRARQAAEDQDEAAVVDIAEPQPGMDLGGLDQVLGFHLRQAQGAMYRSFITTLAEHDLTQKQAGVFWLVGANPGVSQISLAGALGMDRATTMAVVDKLEGRGFIVRQRSTVDRRRQELYLTPAGQKALVAVKATIGEHERRHSELFKPEELETLITYLRRIYRRRAD